MKLNFVPLQKISCSCFDVAHLRRGLITISATDVDVVSIHAILIFHLSFSLVARQRVTLGI